MTRKIIIAIALLAVIVFCACTLSEGAALRSAVFWHSPKSAVTLSYEKLEWEASYGTLVEITENEPVEKATDGHLTTWVIYDFGPFHFARYYGEGAGPISKSYTIKEISSFGNLVLDCSQEDMQADGFDVGDMITLEYGDISMTLPITRDYVYDVTNTGALVWFGDRAPSFGRNSGDFAIDFGFVNEDLTGDSLAGKTCKITMAEKAARKDYYEDIELHMSNDRQDYDSDMEYANVYPVAGGRLKEGRIYRGSSLFNTETNRTEAAQGAVEALKIRNVIDLTMSTEDAKEKASQENWEMNSYVGDLLDKGNIHFFNTGINYKDDFDRDIADVFRTMVNLETPVYINCQLGRDRTGVASIILLAAAGASYDEIHDNFMQTYCNYYKVKPGDPPYDAIEDGTFTIMMKIVTGADDPSSLTADELTAAAAAYLKGGGFGDDEFAALQEYLCE